MYIIIHNKLPPTMGYYLRTLAMSFDHAHIKVQICRMRLYSMAKRSYTDEPPEKSSQWRDSCSTTLMMTVSVPILCKFILVALMQAE